MNTLTLKTRLSDRSRQKFFVTFLAGKVLGLALVYLAIRSLAPWFIGHVAHAAGLSPQADETDRPGRQRDEHGLGAGHRLPGVLHAGRAS